MNRLASLLVLALAPSVALAQAAPQISDSAGIRVVTNDAPGANAPTFRLSAQPRVSIGGVDGAPDYQLGFAFSGTVLRDGSIAVANGSPPDLRIYDQAGKLVRTIRRLGTGLGGGSITGVLAGDTLVLWDGGQNRFWLFTTAGQFVRTISGVTEGSAFAGSIHGLLANGRIVGSPLTIPTSFPAQPSVVRRPQPVMWLGLEGRVAPFGEFPGAEGFQTPMGGGGVGLVFGRGLHISARGDRIAVANDDAYSIRIYDGSGRLLQVVRERREPVAVQPGEWEAALPPALRPGAPRYGSPFERGVDQQPHLTTKPPFGGNSCANSYGGCVRFDQAGNLWVEEYKVSYEGAYGGEGSWHIFDPRGVFLGTFDVPPRAMVLDAGADWVLLNVKDEFERVVLYGSERP